MGKMVVLVGSVIFLAASCNSNTSQLKSLESEKTITPAPATNNSSIPFNSSPALEANCDSNYSGCVPIASDVDCLGGSGNGPAYVRGPVQVIGRDIYGLDRDGDGIGCE